MDERPGRLYWIVGVVLCFANFTHGTGVYASYGKSVHMVCPLRSTSQHPILWLGPENRIGYAINKEINKYLEKRNRVNLTGDHTNGEYNLVIYNTTKKDEGLYQCVTVNNQRSVTAEYNLRVLRKPTLLMNDTTITVTARLEQVSDITLYVDCFPKSTVSWIKTEGGKIGTWTQIEETPGEYKLQSTILPTKPSHFGRYKVLLRNTEGSEEITIYLRSYEPKIHHDSYYTCNTSNDIVMSCSILSDYNRNWNVIWHHYSGGVNIRSLNGTLSNGTSTIRIKYCDYQDTGLYICSWSSGNLKTLAQTVLTVYGPPITTNQSLSMNKDSVVLSVYFYSFTTSLDIKWFSNDNQITENPTSLLPNVNTSILCYDVLVPILGKKTNIELYPSELENAKISCEIRNEFGSSVAIFDGYQNIVSIGKTSVYTETDIESYSSETSVVTTGNTESIFNSEERTDLEYMYVYAVVSGAVIVILLVVVSVTVYKNWTMFHSRLVANQDVIQEIRTSIPQNSSVHTENEVDDSQYDEIDNVSYQSVTWRQYSTIGEHSIRNSTSTDEESVINIANIYDDLTKSQKENHCYCERLTHFKSDLTPQNQNEKL